MTLAKALREHVERLVAHGPRHRDNPDAVIAALDYIEEQLQTYGFVVTREQYGDELHEVNLLASRPTTAQAAILEVATHWDSVAGSPGADDNASGVAGLLEIARSWAGAGGAVRFCVFGGEEEGLVGSHAHVARLAAGEVEGAIVLEMIAYRDTVPGSQRFPDGIMDPATTAMLARQFDKGDFIAAVGNTEAAAYLTALGLGGLAEGLPVLPIPLPGDHDGHAARSDHTPYWRSGRKAVMLTDTAELRNPNYHAPTDTVDSLDFEFAAMVTRTVIAALGVLRP